MSSRLFDAVAVVLVWKDKMFMMKRSTSMLAFPGYHAFVGGKVDKEDYNTKVTSEILEGFSAHLIAALIRELKEELSLDLLSLIDKKNIIGITELGLAVTPDFNPVRFSTHFFRIDFKTKPKFSLDKNEIMYGEWKSAAQWMEDYLRGDILVVPPILTVIKSLGADPHCLNIPNLDFTYDQNKDVPCIESISGIVQCMPLSNTLPPSQRTNCFIIGDHHDQRIVIDPTAKNDSELEKLINTLKKFSFSAIFLTHHHPDHIEYSNTLAQYFHVPIILSHDSFDRICSKFPGFFDQVKIQLIGDGETLTRWKGQEVKTLAVPGHDEGQLAIYPSEKNWCLVGDLIQGVGTVVIGGDEGDMAKYMRSLQLVIDLAPQFIIPSHGIIMGSTYRIEETLKHRQLREEQVLKLYKKTNDLEFIFKEIYPDLDVGLKKYALCNIEKHIDKLKSEGKI